MGSSLLYSFLPKTVMSLNQFSGSSSANRVGPATYRTADLKDKCGEEPRKKAFSVSWDEEQRVGLKVNFVINKLASK